MFRARLRFDAQHALVVARHDLDEPALLLAPAREQPRRDAAARVANMRVEHALHRLHIVGGEQRLELYELLVAPGDEGAVVVEHIRDASAHSSSEVSSGAADHQDTARSHVLTAVVTHTLDHRHRTAVADGEPLAGNSRDVGFAARGAIQTDVADDDVLVGGEGRRRRRVDDQLASGQTLAPEIVRITLYRQSDAARDERAKALSGRTGEPPANGVLGQPGAAVTARHA